MRILFIIYDNESRINLFPSNIGYIISALRDNNEIEIYQQDIFHYEEEHLSNFLLKEYFDIVCIGVIGGYFQYKKLIQISKTINQSTNRPKWYILGGHGPSPEPEFFLKKTGADIVVRGEGELTIKEVVNNIDNLVNVKGISYIKDGIYYHNNDRELIQDINTIQWPSYDLFPIEYYKTYPVSKCNKTDSVMFVLSSRGCIFECTFCYRMDKGYRIRDPKDVVEEIKYLNKNWNINYINFLDELLMSSKENTFNLCEEIIKSGLKIKWYCNGRLNFAKKETLEIMRKAGCVYINYGVESMDDTVLRNVRKNLNSNTIKKGIKNTVEADITPGINIMFGNIGDNIETMQKSLSIMMDYFNNDEMRTIRPVTPYPGSELYYYAIQKGLLSGPEDFYEHKHLNSDLLSVNFTDMEEDEFYNIMFSANKALLDRFSQERRNINMNQLRELYIERSDDFRGFRQT